MKAGIITQKMAIRTVLEGGNEAGDARALRVRTYHHLIVRFNWVLTVVRVD